MIKLNKNIIYLLTFLSITSNAVVTFESIKTSGTGCPANSSFSPTFTSDYRTVVVLFDSDYSVIKNTPYVIGNPITTQKSCTVEASYHASYDEQYVITTNDWRGAVSLPSSTSASVKAETWISYTNSLGINSKSSIVTQTQSFIGPVAIDKSDIFISSALPEIKTVTECGQSFTLNMKLTSSLSSTNTTQDSLLAIDSLDISQLLDSSSIKKIACTNPWNAEMVGPFQNESIAVKITTEKPRINQMASLYVVGLYQGEFYSWTPNQPVVWRQIDFNNTNPNKVFLPYGSGNAPATFNFSINNLSPSYKGAVIYVGVGYGPDENSRYNDLLNSLRYKIVYTIP